jgi:hypothetical protein
MTRRKPEQQASRPAGSASRVDDLIDEAGRESFPASDPPAHSVSFTANDAPCASPLPAADRHGEAGFVSGENSSGA